MAAIDFDAMFSRLKELEELLSFPSVAGHVEQALKIALWLARNAPNRNVADLAMRLVSEIDSHRQGRGTITATGKGVFRDLLEELRDTLLELHPPRARAVGVSTKQK